MRPNSILRPSQRALMTQMAYFPDGIAVMGMGGGKTAATLFSIDDCLEEGDYDHAFIFAPPNTLRNAWALEPTRWEGLSDLSVEILDGSPAQREAILARADADVYVMSSDISTWLVNLMQKWNRRKTPMFDLSRVHIVIDEISKMSSPQSKRGNKMLWLTRRAAGTWGLTGTPRPNRYEDLFLPIKLVGGESVWGHSGFDDWRRELFRPTDYTARNWEIHDFAVPIVEKIAKTFMFYAPPDDLQVPEVVTTDVPVYMNSDQIAHYEMMQETLVAEGVIPDLYGDELNEWLIEAGSAGVASGKLVQIVQGFIYDTVGKTVVHVSTAKLAALYKLDDDLMGSPALLMYGLLEEKRQLEGMCVDKGYRYAVMGDGVTAAAKDAAVRDWINGDLDRIIAHPASMGHGTDGLQHGGHHIVWYHPTWSSEQYFQTIARLARPGQKHVVQNYRLLAQETLDLVKVQRVARKREEELAFIERMAD